MAQLHGSLEDQGLSSMTFLNEVAGRYPDAVSFAAGRPFEDDFDPEDIHRYLRAYCRYLAQERGFGSAEVRRTLYQYGRTKGIINELVARNLDIDEDIHVHPEAIVVTVGCQEAMVLALRALKSEGNDVLLAIAPTYVGLTGAARLVDMRVLTVPGGPRGADLEGLAERVREARRAGLRPRACYVMPDFANPSGVSMDLAVRHALLDFADDNDLLLLEDNPYGLFHGENDRLPTLKSLDARRRVIYLGSYAKTALPGARIGYIIADQTVQDAQGHSGLLADQLAKIKSMLTVNTSPIAQAVVAGKLLENGCSLASANDAARQRYARQMRQLLTGLSARFGGASGLPGVEWNEPSGGFFVVLSLPFPADDELLEYSAREYRLLWTPMHHFYGGTGGHYQLRLCVSLVSGPQIETGLDRLHALVHDRMRRATAAAMKDAYNRLEFAPLKYSLTRQ
jgi:(S)-3,5-dihydroxyphenylglycine transaminase